MKTRSKIHDLFWEKRLGCGDYRFCKLCWSQEEELPEVEKVQHLIEAGFSPSTSFRGCVLNRSSPANMMNHIRAKHHDHLPQNLQEGRTAASPGEKKASIDLTLLRDWAANLVLGALKEVSLIDNDYLRAVLQDRIPGLAHSSRLQEEVDSVVGDLRAEVQKRVGEAAKQGAKFVLSADSWKPRMRVRRSYVAVYLHWVCPETRKREAVCAGVRQTHPPRNGECYRDAFLEVLGDLLLEPSHLCCGMSDHEGAIRRGLRLLEPIPGQALPLVGCGCHAAQ